MKKISRPWIIVLTDKKILGQILPNETIFQPETFEYRGKTLHGYIFDSDEDIVSKIEFFLYNKGQTEVQLFKKIRGFPTKCKLRNLKLIKRLQWIDEKKK